MRVRSYIEIVELIRRDSLRKIPKYHVKVGVAPMAVPSQKIVKDVAIRRLELHQLVWVHLKLLREGLDQVGGTHAGRFSVRAVFVDQGNPSMKCRHIR